jgi:hypothetical protein
MLGEYRIQSLYLAKGSRKAIENKSILAIFLFQPLPNDLFHGLVIHELASGHDGFDLLAQIGLCGDGISKHLARRDRRHTDLASEYGRLCPLPRTRGTK